MPAVMLAVFALTLFLSASLLFIIEPMVGKMMLPLMGGTPAVWNTCMVFFQAVLLAGYGYAHASIKWLGPRGQARLQLGVLAIPFLSFVINAVIASGMLSPNETLVAGREGNPIPALLLVLTICVGMPMAVICTSAPVLQRWFSSTDHPAARDPYFLYGASNLGSMLALIGYPLVIEPYLSLKTQQVAWVVGYAALTGLSAWCAYLMWKARPAVEAGPAAAGGEQPTPASNPVAVGTTAIKSSPKAVSREKAKPGKPAAVTAAEPPPRAAATNPITWQRRARWIALAAVPSSLMLGVTTYITTDIAAIPMLWMPPLILYLMTFIIVFAVISPRTQAILTFAAICLGSLLAAWKGAPLFFQSEALHFMFWVLAALAILAGTLILRVRDPLLAHRVMVIIMPLLLLLLLFMMLSEIQPPSLLGKILLHLMTLFVVAMVCHGELAIDRPAPKHLTEFFLLMSIGGVVGGLFNALVAPVVFNSIVEYQLAMVIACLLLPPIGDGREGGWARWVDVALGGVILLIGLILLVVRFADKVPDTRAVFMTYLLAGPVLWAGIFGLLVFKDTKNWARTLTLSAVFLPLFVAGSVLLLALRSSYKWDRETQTFGGVDLTPFTTLGGWMWALVAVLGAVALAAPGIYRRFKQPAEPDGDEVRDYRLSAVLDLLMPLALLVLVLGLYWGLPSPSIKGRITNIALYLQSKKMMVEDRQLIGVLTFGLPAVLCYTFVERWARFGLGVGALLLGAGVSGVIREGALYQDRSFFGVLKVEDSYLRYPENAQYVEYYYPVHRLVHGTTLHGKQFKQTDIRDTPLSYYHRTGPVGQVFRTFNVPEYDDKGERLPLRPFAVIGLGTGTMASYGVPGQRVDFFDIDPVVVDIAWDSNEFFHFAEDAEDRGVEIGLVLGDARLTFDPRDWRERKKIAEAPASSEFKPVTDDVKQKRLLPLRKRKGQPKPARRYGPDLTSSDRYRLIVVDAFSSDAIPVHLITRQAVQIYLDRLDDDGVLCMHISNRYLDLQPLLANIAVELGLVGMHMSDDDAEPPGKNRSHWVALARGQETLDKLVNVPRWQTDADQLALLGMSLYPAQTLGPNPVAGMCHAFQAIAQVQAIEGAKQSGRSGDPRNGPAEWEPLETTPYLEGLVARNEAEIAELDRRLAEIKRAQDDLEKPIKEYEKPLTKLQEELNALTKQLIDVEDQLREGSGDTVKLLEQQRDLRRKKEVLERKMEPDRKKKEELDARKGWLDRLEERMTRQKDRLTRANKKVPTKLVTNRKVGVPTDDYVNLLAVFSW